MKVGQYINTGNVQLPISSLMEEFKIGKVCLHMMMRDSADDCIWRVHPEIKSEIKSEIKIGQLQRPLKLNPACKSKISWELFKIIELDWAT